MDEPSTNPITVKQVEDLQVAAIRFLGSSDEIPMFFDQLEAVAGKFATGSPIFLYYWGNVGPEQDIELCLPVVQRVETSLVHTRVLKGGKMLTTRHLGSDEQISSSWKRLTHAMQEYRIGWGNGPGREIHLEGADLHGAQSGRYLTEIQVPMLLPEWIGHLEEGLTRISERNSAQYIVGDGHAQPYDASARERALWVQGMLDRLEGALPDKNQQHKVLAGCSHIFPERRVQQLREKYQQYENLEELIAFMNEDRSERGANYYESPRRDGDLIRVTKIPYNAEAYKSAATPLEKKLAYCHCPMVKDALREGISLSPVYCACGAGWYHTLWEGILDHPVKVDVVCSLLKGDETCEFAIHLT